MRCLDATRRPVSPPFDRSILGLLPRMLLREGRWANARVARVEHDGVDWVVKDFASRHWWVRNTIGRLLVRRELHIWRRLAGIKGIAPQAFRIDAHALAIRYIPGVTLDKADRRQLDAEFFGALETLLDQVHARGVVHLDTRGSGNMLVTPEGTPALIDFQAAFSTAALPRAVHRWLTALDMTGVYKKWLQHEPATLGSRRQAVYERMSRRRRLWVARGYAGAAKREVVDRP